MTTIQPVPTEILNQTIATRMAWFKDYTVAHPRLRVADRQLRDAILEPAGASFIFVIGPARVGKTTLKAHVEHSILQTLHEQDAIAPGQIPLLSMEAPAPENGMFHWKDYYIRALIALDEPLIREKRFGYHPEGAGHTLPSRIAGRATAPEYRLALESALHHRRPLAVIIDEAQHFAKMASGRHLQDQLDCLKSMANLTGIVHVLVGPYELLALRNLSAQLSGRSLTIHFGRYHLTDDLDCHQFQNVLRAFQQHLPLLHSSDLLPHWRYCYERSIGCIGVVKAWFVRALYQALSDGAPQMTLEHLTQHAPSLGECEQMAREILAGEATLTENESRRESLRRLLGWEHTATPPDLVEPQGPSKRSRKARRAGERLPHRDAVGEPLPVEVQK